MGPRWAHSVSMLLLPKTWDSSSSFGENREISGSEGVQAKDIWRTEPTGFQTEPQSILTATQ